MMVSNAARRAFPVSLEWFQSLFSWMMVSNHLYEKMSVVSFKFQSLFSWMMVSNLPPCWRCRPSPSVSILVFLDDGLEP